MLMYQCLFLCLSICNYLSLELPHRHKGNHNLLIIRKSQTNCRILPIRIITDIPNEDDAGTHARQQT